MANECLVILNPNKGYLHLSQLKINVTYKGILIRHRRAFATSWCYLQPPSILDGFNSCSHASAPFDFEMSVFALDDFYDILRSLFQMTMYNNVL